MIKPGNPNRAAGRDSKRVLAKRSPRSIEEAAGVHLLIAQELPQSAVILVGAGLADDADDSTRYAAVFGQVIMRLGLELLNVVHDRLKVIRRQERVQIVDSVEEERIAPDTRAIDRGEERRVGKESRSR